MSRGFVVFLAISRLSLAALGSLLFARLTAAEDLLFDRLSIEEGLSSVHVNDVLKDKRGFVWIATNGGLDRFDGQRIVTHKPVRGNPASLADEMVVALFEDRRGRLWVGTAAGLQRYDRETDRFETVPLSRGMEPSGIVNALAEDASGRLWAATTRGLFVLDPVAGTAQRCPSDPNDPSTLSGNDLRSVLVDRNGRIWVGTRTFGVNRVDAATMKVTRVPHDTGEPDATGGSDAVHLHEDADGRIWVSSLDGGLSMIEPSSGRVRRYMPDPARPEMIGTQHLRRALSDGRGQLYVATDLGGLEVMDMASGRFRRYLPRRGDDRSIGSALLLSLTIDDQGILWIGTATAGVRFTSEAQRRFGVIQARCEDELSDPHVPAVLVDRAGELWVGTDGGGLNRFAPGAKRPTVYRHDPRDPASIGSDSVRPLRQGADGRIWFSAWGAGLGLIDPRTGRIERYGHGRDSAYDKIFRTLEDGPRHFLVASAGGLERFDHVAGTFEPVSVVGGSIPRWIATLGRDRVGNVWLGALPPPSVYQIDRESGRLVEPSRDTADPAFFGPGPATVFLLDSRGNFWIGFDGGGLRCLPATAGPVRVWTTADGLPSNKIKDMLEDESGSLWASSDQGIFRIEDAVSLPARPRVASFDAADGLQGPMFRFGAAFRSPSGEMFFGGESGLNRFFPARIRLNAHPPDVLLTGLRLFGQPVSVGTKGSPLTKAMPETSELTLAHGQSIVTFEFAALNYLLPKKNRYAYRLAPIEKEWNEAGHQGSVTYALAPGNYVLQVKAANNDGVWSQKATELRVRVKPPLWLSWWAYGFYVALGASVLAIGYRRRVRQMAARHLELEMTVAERTAELAASTESLRARGDELARENEERKRAEEEAGRERDLLHALMDNTPDLIYFNDRESHFIRVNQALARRFGMNDPREAVGKTGADFFGEEHARQMLADEQRVVSTGEPMIAVEEKETWPDGHVTWVSTSKAPIRDATGQVGGLVGVSHDITDRKQLEDQLRQGQKMEAIGRLAGGVAHDFNNLLGVIIGGTEAAMKRLAENGALRPKLAEVLKAAQRGAALTRQLLAFSRRQVLQPKAVDLNDVVSDTDAMLRRLIGEDIVLTTLLDPELGSVWVDPGQVAQIIMNLVVNARDAMPQGGRLTIETQNVELGPAYATRHPGTRAGRYVMLAVSDTGTGMDKETQAHLFEPFFTTKDKGKGTGLGLSTVYGIVKQSDGHIRTYSEPRVGTTFKIYLPRIDTPAVAPVDSWDSGAPPAGGDETVLLVEDEASLRDIVRDVLQDNGYTVLVAEDGNAALQLAERYQGAIDLMVTDVIMPGMSGHTAAAEIARTRPRTKVLYVSGYTEEAVAHHGDFGPGAAFLSKPFTSSDLLRKCRELLDERDSAQAGRQA